MEYSSPKYWSGYPFPSAGHFPTQGSNPRHTHCRHVLYHLSHREAQWDLITQLTKVQWLSRVWLFVIPWTASCQASMFITNSRSLLKFMSIESLLSYKHLILCLPLLLLPSIFTSIRVFSKESVLHIRWPKYWSFSFSISPSNEYSERFPLGLIGLTSLKSKRLSRVFSNTS